MADGRTGRLFDPVRTGSQQPAPLRFRTFNSRLMRGTIPPPVTKIPTLIGWDFFARSPSVGEGSGPDLASVRPVPVE